jgi:hypothetical protein
MMKCADEFAWFSDISCLISTTGFMSHTGALGY